jgi:hypothetical protein
VNGKGDRWCHAVVTFESHEDAAAAISKIHGMAFAVSSVAELALKTFCEFVFSLSPR